MDYRLHMMQSLLATTMSFNCAVHFVFNVDNVNLWKIFIKS